MSKCKYVKKNNMIVTASRGRAVKVIVNLYSFGKFPLSGEIYRQKLRNKDRFR